MLELLSENADNVLGFKALETITLEDFRQVLAPRLAAIMKEWGRARLLLHLDEDFQGFDLEAFKGEAFGSKHHEHLEKIAVVGGSFMIKLQIRLAATLLGGEVETFGREELAEAWEWVRG